MPSKVQRRRAKKRTLCCGYPSRGTGSSNRVRHFIPKASSTTLDLHILFPLPSSLYLGHSATDKRSHEEAKLGMESFTFAQPIRISTLPAYVSDEQTVSPMSSFPPILIPSRRGSASSSSPGSLNGEGRLPLMGDGQHASRRSCGNMTTEQRIVLEGHFSKPSAKEKWQALAHATGLPVHHIAVSLCFAYSYAHAPPPHPSQHTKQCLYSCLLPLPLASVRWYRSLHTYTYHQPYFCSPALGVFTIYHYTLSQLHRHSVPVPVPCACTTFACACSRSNVRYQLHFKASVG